MIFFRMFQINENIFQAGQNIRLFVTVSDGELPAKHEVFVNILKASKTYTPPPFTGNVKNGHQKPKNDVTTHLRPVKVEKEDVKNDLSEEKKETTTVRINVTQKSSTTESYGDNKLFDQAVKSPPDVTVTVVPIISVCVVFLMVGIIALVFRKKIHLGKPKSSKEDIVSRFFFATKYCVSFFFSEKTIVWWHRST